jgi:hypothetical protein
MPYRFNNKGHIHEYKTEGGEWAPLIGTTSLINEVYPPPLAWYGSEKALEPFGFISPKKEQDSLKRRELAEKGLEDLQSILDSDNALERYIELLESAYKNHDNYKKKKGKEGKDKHALIELYIKWVLRENAGRPAVDELAVPELITPIQGFYNWATKDVERFIWSEANCYSKSLWLGGITDFGFIDKNGKKIIGDAKPSVYPKHWIQTSAYGIQIAENGLFDEEGQKIIEPMNIDGYCIFDYNKNEVRYLGAEWKARLERIVGHTVEVYKIKDLVGASALQT